MKRLTVVSVLLTILTCMPLNAQDCHVGYADAIKILENSVVRKEINAHSKSLTEQLRKYENEQTARFSTVSPEQRQAIQASIADKRGAIKIALRINKNKMQDHHHSIRDRIKEIAERHKLSYVFTTESMVVLVDGYKDITDEVIARINEQE